MSPHPTSKLFITFYVNMGDPWENYLFCFYLLSWFSVSTCHTLTYSFCTTPLPLSPRSRPPLSPPGSEDPPSPSPLGSDPLRSLDPGRDLRRIYRVMTCLTTPTCPLLPFPPLVETQGVRPSWVVSEPMSTTFSDCFVCPTPPMDLDGRVRVPSPSSGTVGSGSWPVGRAPGCPVRPHALRVEGRTAGERVDVETAPWSTEDSDTLFPVPGLLSLTGYLHGCR